MKEMKEAAEFYANKIITAYKDKSVHPLCSPLLFLTFYQG